MMTYSPKVSAALAALEDHRMPLTQNGSVQNDLTAAAARDLFPAARAAEAARSGLFLYLGGWQQAHNLAQEIETAEGSYWHAIVHRQEPDAGNSAYWFRQVGRHPIFNSLREAAARIVEDYPESAIHLPANWDPSAFIDLCESAREKPGSALERAAIEIQHAEWVRLFEWCAESK
jgi:hypothetical protein